MKPFEPCECVIQAKSKRQTDLMAQKQLSGFEPDFQAGKESNPSTSLTAPNQKTRAKPDFQAGKSSNHQTGKGRNFNISYLLLIIKE